MSMASAKGPWGTARPCGWLHGHLAFVQSIYARWCDTEERSAASEAPRTLESQTHLAVGAATALLAYAGRVLDRRSGNRIAHPRVRAVGMRCLARADTLRFVRILTARIWNADRGTGWVVRVRIAIDLMAGGAVGNPYPLCGGG